MRILVGGSFQGGFLDYSQGPGLIGIAVSRMFTLRRVDGRYFERARDPRRIVNYVRAIGIRATVGKVISRTAERYRNDKYLSVGIGIAKDGPATGREVVFVACCHPRCADRLVLPEELVCRSDGIPVTKPGLIEHYEDLSIKPLPAGLEAAVGWDPESGHAAPVIDWSFVTELLRGVGAPVRTLVLAEDEEMGQGQPRLSCAEKSGTLFGFGNYAKTVIIPSLPQGLTINRIHECDPLQLPRKRDPAIFWSTSPYMSPDDPSKVVFIAGYHHTHTPLAVEALARGKDCVVEKPLVTSRSQVAELKRAFDESKARYFACFQKRFSRLNELARGDLGVARGDPINYHAIVFEVPLPERHWYKWPNSRSRLVSNGCHWVDHFLFLNEWSEPVKWNVHEASDGTLAVYVALRNGACMTMTLTDKGSDRIGVQDHIELRAGSVTVKIINDSRYFSENSSRVLRRSRVNKMSTYRDMYREIGRRIINGSDGDNWESIATSSLLILELEEALYAGLYKSRMSPTPGPPG